MKKNRKVQSPLLYVHQPKLNTPKAHMQQHDRSNKITEVSNEGQPKKHKKKFSRKRHMPTNRILRRQEEIDGEMDQQIDDEGRNEEQRHENVTFSNMTTREKIAYLAREPKFISKIRCEIKTMENTFRGTVHTFDDDTVYFQIGRRQTTEKIPFEDIQEIHILGLKK